LPQDLPETGILWQIFASCCTSLHRRYEIHDVQNSLYLQAFYEFFSEKEVVGWPGLEPGTNGLKGRCSTD
jgi:hypothetical protein